MAHSVEQRRRVLPLRAVALTATLLLFGGCGSTNSSSSVEPRSSSATDQSASPSARPQCATASRATTSTVNATVQAKDARNSVAKVVSWADPQGEGWWLVGAISGPTTPGEGALGIWATEEDPTQESFAGSVSAVDGGAHTWSTAPENELVKYDPTDVPALGCWSQNRS